MRLKKVLSAITAATVMLTSTLSAWQMAGATLLPLDTYNAQVTLSGYTSEELKAVPISDILDNLEYSESYTIDVDTSESTGEAETAEGADTSESGETPEGGESDTPVTSSNTSIDIELDADKLAAVTVNRGDKVEISEAAAKVWMSRYAGGYDMYYLAQADSTVDLSFVLDYMDTEETSYTFDMTVIVGSGKQLDPGNIRYEVEVTVDLSYAIKDVYRVYKMVDGEQVDLDVARTYSYTLYLTDTITNDDDIYFEYSGVLVDTDGNEIEAERTVTYSGGKQDDNGWLCYGYDVYRYTDVDVQWTIDGEVVRSQSIDFWIFGSTLYISNDVTDINDNNVIRSIYINDESYENGIYNHDYSYKLRPGYSLDDNYFYRIYDIYKTSVNSGYSDNVVKAVEGKYSTLAETAELTDIKDSLIGWNADGVPITTEAKTYTIFVDKAMLDGESTTIDTEATEHVVINLTVNLREETSTSTSTTVSVPTVNTSDRYFRVNRAAYSSSYAVSYDVDSYYSYGYQTLFVLPTSDLFDMTKLDMFVYLNDSNINNVFNVKENVMVDFDKMTQDFSEGEVQYTVSTRNDGTKNYFVNVKPVEEGAKLYVHGPNERSVFFNDHYGYDHDILIANIGDEQLTGLKVELVDAKNIKLDSYWTVGGEKNETLAAFTTTDSDEMANLAKVKLLPDGDGDISGTLKISADGQETYTIKLTGKAGDPKIVTESPLPEAVKYVPYNAIIATDNIFDWNMPTFYMTGKLPKGMSFDRATGEIYGVAQETGTFQFSVYAYFPYTTSTQYIPFELTILDNTNENVYNASDDGYTIETHIGTAVTGEDYAFNLYNAGADQLFVSVGEYDGFEAVWLNGQKLEADVDYTSEEGSTRITIKSQTFKNLEIGSSNTIAAEFRVGGEDSLDLKRTAQNFVITAFNTNTNIPSTPTVPDSGTTGGSTSGTTSGWGGGFVTNTTPVSPIPQSVLDTVKGSSVDTNTVNEATAKFAEFVGSQYAGYFANLYKYDEAGKKLDFIACVKVDDDGIARFGAVEAGDYAVYTDKVTHIKGDMDNNIGVNALDASVILRWITGLTVLDDPMKGDVDGNGVVNANDAAVILKKAVGLM